MFSYNLKRIYEAPDDAHQVVVDDLKSFMKSSTKSPGFFVPFILDKMNTLTNIFDYGCIGDYTVDTPYAKRFNTSTFHPRFTREVVAKEKSYYRRSVPYGTTDHPMKYTNFNSSGLSLNDDDEKSSISASNVYTSDVNELTDDISTTKKRIDYCQPETTTIICDTTSRVSDLEYVASRSINDDGNVSVLNKGGDVKCLKEHSKHLQEQGDEENELGTNDIAIEGNDDVSSSSSSTPCSGSIFSKTSSSSSSNNGIGYKSDSVNDESSTEYVLSQSPQQDVCGKLDFLPLKDTVNDFSCDIFTDKGDIEVNEFLKTQKFPYFSTSENQCCATSVILCIFSMTSISKDIISCYQKVALDRSDCFEKFKNSKCEEMNVDNICRKTLISERLPLTTVMVKLGHLIQDQILQKEVIDNHASQVNTRNSSVSIVFNKIFNDLKKFIPQELVDYKDEYASKHSLSFIMSRLRSEIFTFTKEDITRHTRLVTCIQQKCSTCSRQDWKTYDNPTENDVIFDLRNPTSREYYVPEKLQYPFIPSQEKMIHINDLFLLNNECFGVFRSNLNKMSCGRCGSSQSQHRVIAMNSPKFLIFHTDRSFISKKRLKNSVYRTFSKKEKGFTKIYVSDNFLLRTFNSSEKYVFQNAICFEEQSKGDKYFVLSRLGEKRFPCKITSRGGEILSEDVFANKLFTSSSLIFYTRANESHEMEFTSVSLYKFMGTFPRVPDEHLINVESTFDFNTQKYGLRKSVRLNTEDQKRVYSFDFSKNLITFGKKGNPLLFGKPLWNEGDVEDKVIPPKNVVIDPDFSSNASSENKNEDSDYIQSDEEDVSPHLESPSLLSKETLINVKKRKHSAIVGKDPLSNKKQRSEFVADGSIELGNEKVDQNNDASIVENSKETCVSIENSNTTTSIISKMNNQKIERLMDRLTRLKKEELFAEWDTKMEQKGSRNKAWENVLLKEQIAVINKAQSSIIHKSISSTLELHDEKNKSLRNQGAGDNYCHYCDETSDVCLGKETYICYTCANAYRISVSGIQLIAENIEKFMVDHPSSEEICVRCLSLVKKNINRYHCVGNLVFCDKCIDTGKCKCQVCMSKKHFRTLASKAMILNLEPQSSPIRLFLNRELYSSERNIITFIKSEDESKERFFAHSRKSYVTYEVMENFIQYEYVKGRTVWDKTRGDIMSQETVIDITTQVLDETICAHFVTLLMDATDESIFYHHFSNTSALKSSLKSFVTDSFVHIPMKIFGKGKVCFLLNQDNTHWLIAQLTIISNDMIVLKFISTNTNYEMAKTFIGALEMILKDEFNMVFQDESMQMPTIIQYNAVFLSQQNVWPHTEDTINGAMSSHIDAYALFILRDFVLGEVSPLSQDVRKKLLLFMVLCFVYKTPSYCAQRMEEDE